MPATETLVGEEGSPTVPWPVLLSIPGLLNASTSHWLTDSRLLRYQALLLGGQVLQLKTCLTLNPAMFLPETEGESVHNCQQVLLQTSAARADLQEIPLDNPEWTLFTDGSSFMENDTHESWVCCSYFT